MADRQVKLEGSEKVKRINWIDSVLPYNIAYGPISTLIQIFILNFHGTVIDVGLTVTAYNAVSVPAVIFWGFVTDRFHKRKPLITLSYMVTSVMLFSLFFTKTVYSVSLLYASLSFAATASITPLNIMVMETERKQKWATAFARLSMIASIGQTVGLILSMTWAHFLPLNYIVFPLAILSLISASLSMILIKEPAIIFERNVITMTKTSFFERFKTVPYLFLKVPRLNDFKRIFKTLKHDLTKHVPLLYFSIFGFYLASEIFNTSVVPSLQANQTLSTVIFLISTIAMLGQIISFKYAGAFIEKLSLVKAATWGLILRSTIYGLLGASAFLVPKNWLWVPFLIFYPIAAGFAYAIYYTASNTMVFNTLGHTNQGSYLGVYSALVGMAIMTGSLISGFTSFFFGFQTTFLLAAVCLAISAWFISRLLTFIPSAKRKSASDSINAFP